MEITEVLNIVPMGPEEQRLIARRYNTFPSMGDFMNISLVSNLLGIDGGWELNPPEDPNPAYMELFQ